MKKEIYARAVPKSIKITENYSYDKVISANSSSSLTENPNGKIEVSVPYDGHDYFKREAFKDIIKQISKSVYNQEIEAVIGYLAINKYDNTDLENLIFQCKKYESIPLRLPIVNDIIGIDRLCKENYICLLEHSYQPRHPDLKPININIEVLDDAFLIMNLPKPKEKLNKEKAKNLANIITGHVYSGNKNLFPESENLFKGKLILSIDVRVFLPDFLSTDSYPDAKNPKISKLSLKWPTITSLQNIKLSILKLTSHNQVINDYKNVTYNPLNQSLEWIAAPEDDNALMTREQTNNSNTEWQIYHQNMLILIEQPGEIYQQVSLEGKIEVDVTDRLLSGLQVRFYGLFNDEFGKYNPKIPQLNTRINANFKLFLDEVFQKRKRSFSQELKFENIIPNEDSIRIIKDELQFQGFDYKKEIRASNSDREEWQWIIPAWRSEGIDTMELWIVILGTEYEVKREAQRGSQKFESMDKSGELTMYILGQFPRSSYHLIQKINILQKELRKKFERLKLEN